MDRRVVVTGIGVVVPHGRGIDPVFDAVHRGCSAIDLVETGSAELATLELLARCPVDVATEVTGPRRILMDRVSMLAAVAGRDAVSDAGLDGPGELADAGLFVGCAIGGAEAIQAAHERYVGRRTRRIRPTSVPMGMPSAPTAHLGIDLGIRGPAVTFSVACSSSSIAVGEGALAIRHGRIDRALVGGSEAMLNDVSVAAWQSMGVLAASDPEEPAASCRPFDAGRTGFVLGEGAAFLVLEERESALARGAPIRAEIVGYGTSNDAVSLTDPDAEGQARAIRAAPHDAGVAPESIGYVNAHATATEVGDVAEVEAIRAVFGIRAGRLAVSSTKSMHGHLIGAAGALEAALTIEAVRTGRIPPTANLRAKDPACDVDVVPDPGRTDAELEFALSNSFAFGGSNAALLFRKP